MREALEASLPAAWHHRVDLYQLHNLRMDTIDSDETFETLEQLKAEGKIRHYGVAPGRRSGGARRACGRSPRARSLSILTVYNVLVQEPGRALIDAARRQGICVMARVPRRAAGRQTHARDHVPGGRPSPPPPVRVDGRGPQKIERIRFLCENVAKRTMAQAALRFILDSGATTVISDDHTSEAELLEHVGAAASPSSRARSWSGVSALYERFEPVGAKPAVVGAQFEGSRLRDH